ncbi:N-acetyltransferase family protein [Streptomyces nigra]|jgi:ribosomal protein S18 acetylase RimI-like enzyme|uniref:GNAT family N-acetyltransferase n=1 Tax=Streptomyces nigra TaxID=1827580 RepID=A0ABZ1IQ80_9ACTN
MTTTLRPTEPLQRHPDGTRSRRYQVCVNGRPVGVLLLGTHPVFGEGVARVTELRIEEADRRRGRATVAALAAEEVARGWGCTRIEVTVPGDAVPALRLVTALGYLVRNRGMAKALGDTPPALPPGSRARPMTESEYAEWIVKSDEDYVRSWVERGVPEDEARAKSRRDHEALLPHGLRTPGTTLDVLEHEGTPVGTVWVGTHQGRAYVYDVETVPEHRGRGHGRSLMLLAEGRAIAAGHRMIGLNVFAGNAAAERLYDSLGYETTAYALYKNLL